MAKCDCYFQHGTKFLCYGTKEREECSCGGDESKCNFYPEKRKLKMATEKRLIDANALDIVANEDGIANGIWIGGRQGGQIMRLVLSTLKKMIEDAPTVDAVEVVRCKDCVYYREEDLLCVGVSCVGDSHANWYPDDFCSYGERKTDDST